MTKITKYICNKCDKEITGVVYGLNIADIHFMPIYDGIAVQYSRQPKEYNLCGSCTKEVKEYLNYEN
jgi:hypothetical protein